MPEEEKAYKDQLQCGHPLQRRKRHICLDCDLYMPDEPIPIRLVSDDNRSITIELVEEDGKFFMVEFKTWPHMYHWNVKINEILDFLIKISLNEVYYQFDIKNLKSSLEEKFNQVSFNIIVKESI